MSFRYRLAAPLLLFHRLLRQRDGLRILLFHDLPPEQMPAFHALVAALAEAGRLATPDEAEAVLSGGAEARPGACLLSFDDGFASNLAAARTVMARHGAKGLFFVCPGLMDLPATEQPAAIARNVFDGKRTAADLPAGLRLMDWDEVGALTEDGHAIGSHTMSHRRLTLLSTPERAEEIGGAAEALHARLGVTPAWFAFPFGDIGSVDAEVLRDVAAHHRFCRSGVRGPNSGNTPAMAVRADQVELSAPPAWQWLAVDGGLDRRYAEARQRLDRYAAQSTNSHSDR